MTSGRIYLDTNIFIAAFEGDESDTTSRRLIDLFATGDRVSPPRFCTSELTLAELLVKPYRSRDEVALLRFESLLTTSSWLEVGPIDRSILSGAALLRTYPGIKLPDAIHLSTALHFRCSSVLTDDTGITGPFALTYADAGRAWKSDSVAVLRPTEAVIDELTLDD